MTNLNAIGLEKANAKMLAEKLNLLLANYSIFYQNTRGFHWNITGEKFFELHAKFEELYNDLFVKIDDVAERILTLGFQPEYRFSAYKNTAQLNEAENTADGIKAVEQVLEAFKTLLVQQREIMDLAGQANDEGTSALMSDYIREQEKLVWMYSAFLK